MTARHYRHAAIAASLIALLISPGCGGVPPAAPALAEAIEARTAEEQRAYVALLDRYFALRRIELDRAFLERYVPGFLEELANSLEVDGLGLDDLSRSDWIDVVRELTSVRDSLQRRLEEQRVELVRETRDRHALTREGQVRLSAYLTARAERDAAADALRERLGVELPTGMDELLRQVGDVARQLAPPHTPDSND